LGLAEIAFAAGFGSIRQFNDTLRKVYGVAPSVLRTARRPAAAPGGMALRLAYRAPLHSTALLEFLAARAIPGVEHADPSSYSRELRLPHGTGSVTLTPAAPDAAEPDRLPDRSGSRAAPDAAEPDRAPG